MSTYATAAAVANYIEGWVTEDPIALERLIQRAETDIDSIVVARARRTLPPTQVITLVSAQSGTFSLNWGGNTPAGFTEAYNVSGSQLQSDLSSLVDVGVGNVTVLGNNPFTVVWDPQWAGDYDSNLRIPLLQVDGSGLLPSEAQVLLAAVRGRNVSPLTDLNGDQAIALSNAVCAQVEYRNAMGEDFFVRPQFSSVKGPDFQTSGKLPFVAPKAKRELARTGLLLHLGRAVGGPSYRSGSSARII